MTQDQLWAPWRLSYIKTKDDETEAESAPQEPGCFLCRYLAADPSADAENFVVARTARSVAVLNRFPYNNGHMLIAPVAHKSTLEELDQEELLDGMLLLRRMTTVLGKVLNAEGVNIGLNLGSAAGAGLPGHLHWHIVPRWNGDSNFMTVVADVNVIPQSLRALYDMLQESLNGEG